MNNAALIRPVGMNLQRWYAIPMNHYEPKAQSLAALKEDALLLERWQRQGEPLRYALGYYPGQRLWLALQKAIDTYVPPPAPPWNRYRKSSASTACHCSIPESGRLNPPQQSCW